MKKLFLTKTRWLVTIMMLTILSVGNAWAEYAEVATFQSSAVINNTSSYATYQNDDWYLSRGGGGTNNSCGWNNTTGQNVTLDQTFGVSGITAGATYGFYIYSKSALANVEKITITSTGTTNNMSSTDKLYLLYSTDGGSSWSQITLTSGTQGASAGTSALDKTFTFSKIASARYAILFNGGSTTAGKFRFDNVEITFYRERVMRTVEWRVENVEYTAGTPSTSVEVGSKVTTLTTPPSVPAGCTSANPGAKFMGWTATANYQGAGAPADLFTNAAGAPDAPAGSGTIYYYAVFADPVAVDP